MAGKIMTVLIKREAEAYRAQGLHKEALALYNQLMASSPNIDPSLKNAIQIQVDGIYREMQTFDAQRDMPLSSDEILRIKQSWGQQACQADIMICTQALLFQVDAYKDALLEYRKLLQAGCDPEKLTETVVRCLCRVYSPQKLPRAVDALVTGVFKDTKKALTFKLRLAKALADNADKAHVLAYYDHLKHHPDLPKHVAARLDQVLAKHRNAQEASSDESAPVQESPKSHRDRCFSRFIRTLTSKISCKREKAGQI
jgi:tetratricopeptide (TPR) repeat protein